MIAVVLLAGGALGLVANRPADAQISGVLPTVAISTPPLGHTAAQAVLCSFANVSGSDRAVRIRIRNTAGEAVRDVSYTAPSGQVRLTSYFVPSIPFAPAFHHYCTFSFFGSKADLRAAGAIQDSIEIFAVRQPSGSDLVVVPAS